MIGLEMCGIFCAFGLGGQALEPSGGFEEFITDAKELMHARGPDSFGYHLSKERDALLIHSRLAIRGLERAYNQPFNCEDDSVLVYNGEVYRFGDITLGEGHGSDTPFFARGIIEGAEGQSLIDGMFAYVRYDPKNRKIAYGRDIFGEKTLYRVEYNGYVFLFSEVRYLRLVTLVCGLVPRVSRSFIARMLIYGYRQVHKDGGIEAWEDVTEISPSSYFELDLCDGKTSQKRIYDVQKAFMGFAKKEMKLDKDRMISEFIDDVRSRAPSDVSTGLCLSSGIDSNVVASILCSSEKRPEYAFTVSSNDPRYSEFEKAEQAARIYGIKQVRVEIDRLDNPVDLFYSLTKKRRSPFLTLSSFASCCIARKAQEYGIKVIYSGLGGDELFSGYYDYFFYRMVDSDYTSAEAADFERYILPYVHNPIMKNGCSAKHRVIQLEHHYPSLPQRLEMLSPYAYVDAVRESIVPGLCRLRTRMFSDIVHDVVRIILHEDDINFMEFSIENRTPLLTKRILELSLATPNNELMRDGYQKCFLRDVLRRVCPELSFIYSNRRKQGYNYGLHDFISTDPSRFWDIFFCDSLVWEILDRQKIEASLREDIRFDDMLTFCIFSAQSFILSSRH